MTDVTENTFKLYIVLKSPFPIILASELPELNRQTYPCICIDAEIVLINLVDAKLQSA